jgi:hypothetical protein
MPMIAYPHETTFQQVEIFLHWIELSAYILNARHDRTFSPQALADAWFAAWVCRLKLCPT